MIRTVERRELYVPFRKLGPQVAEICFGLRPLIDKGADGNDVDTGFGEWWAHRIVGRTDTEAIRDLIVSTIDAYTAGRIVNGLRWEVGDGKTVPVRLTTENQYNFKAAYDRAFQTQGGTLPVTLKLGTPTEPHYLVIDTLEQFTEFYSAVLRHIDTMMQEGWDLKDGIDWKDYELD